MREVSNPIVSLKNVDIYISLNVFKIDYQGKCEYL